MFTPRPCVVLADALKSGRHSGRDVCREFLSCLRTMLSSIAGGVVQSEQRTSPCNKVQM